MVVTLKDLLSSSESDFNLKVSCANDSYCFFGQDFDRVWFRRFLIIEAPILLRYRGLGS